MKSSDTTTSLAMDKAAYGGINDAAPVCEESVRMAKVRMEAENTAPALEPVHGDILPYVGEWVLIHLARQNEWVAHQVTGFYAWPGRPGDPWSVRLFVRVKGIGGESNARLLEDVLRLDKTPFHRAAIMPAKVPVK